MVENLKTGVLEKILAAKREQIKFVYLANEGEHISWQTAHARGFANFIKTLDEIARLKDPAVLVLYGNVLAQVAVLPAADRISASLRRLVVSANGDVEVIKELGRVVFTTAVKDESGRHDFLHMPRDAKRSGPNYIRKVIDRLRRRFEH